MRGPRQATTLSNMLQECATSCLETLCMQAFRLFRSSTSLLCNCRPTGMLARTMRLLAAITMGVGTSTKSHPGQSISLHCRKVETHCKHTVRSVTCSGCTTLRALLHTYHLAGNKHHAFDTTPDCVVTHDVCLLCPMILPGVCCLQGACAHSWLVAPGIALPASSQEQQAR